MCARWHRFALFFLDLGPRPSPKHSLERVDNACGYEPGNVAWATVREQSRNKRSTRLIEHDGQVKCVTDWADHLGLNRNTLRSRLHRGWSFEEAIENCR